MPTTKKVTKKKTSTTKTAEQKAILNAGKIPFMIGSDPEYLLFYGQRGLDASEMIKKFFQGGPYEATNTGFMIPNVGDFGWDGAASTGELRPNATKNIHTHVTNIEKMLTTINGKMPFVDISTLSIGSPIGGHIHLDSFVHNNPDYYIRECGMTKEGQKVKRRAEKLISTFLLPLVASDHRISAMARLSSYGNIDDIKYEQKSSSYTAEIRGLTAEWLTTPKIAYATLAYLATVWHEISKNHKKLNENPNILRQAAHSHSVHRLLLSDYELITTALTRELKKTVRTFELYPQFKKEIDFIMNPKRVYNAKEKVGWNINQGWGFNSKLPKITKKSLMSDEAVQAVLAKENVPNIERSFAVNYNDDYNVAHFAKAISDRVATMNWPLKNTYSLYGFRKGVTGITADNGADKYYSFSGNQPKSKTRQTAESMKGRLTQNGEQQYGATRINPKTGRTQGKNQGTVILGLPYDIRASGDVSSMIELMYKIEKGQIEAKSYNQFNVDEGEVSKNEDPDLGEVIESSPRNTRHSTLDDSIENIINESTS